MSFRAVYLDHAGPGAATLRDLDDHELPEAVAGSVTVDVAYSTLNYKDALAITGTSPVVRRFPMVAGIDFAGTVRESLDERWWIGDEVVLTGFHAGETHWGGLAERARVPGTWLVPKPATLTLFETMAIGTAGFTAALCLRAIERHGVQTGAGDVLVTGATGGVGSLAVMMLAARGFRVVASTGKLSEAAYLHLKRLGAAEVIDRRPLERPGKPLQVERWAAAIDTLGSHTLANVCASTRTNGIVAACGLAQGMDLPATVAPFILRGVTLAGVNSIFVSASVRQEAWQMLEQLLDRRLLRDLTREIGLADVIATAPRFLQGQVSGRIVVATS